MELSLLGKAIPSFGSPTLEGFDLENMVPGERISGKRRQFVQFYIEKKVEPVATEAFVNERTGEVKVLKTEPRTFERMKVKIVTPGDKNSVDDYAQDYHKREFWEHYKAFRDGRTVPQGTSLDECSFISPSIATELRYMGVHVLEQLADASDDLANHIPSGWELREYARAMCKGLGSKEDVNLLKSELEKSQSVIEKLQSEMAELRGMLLNSRGEVITPSQAERKVEVVAPVASVIKKSPGRPKNIKESV